MKIDFHTHILPQIDDGAESTDTALSMLEYLRHQDVTTVVLTPHYYSHRKPINEFLAQREQAYEQLCAAHTPDAITLRLGAEVYFSDYLFNNRDLSPLCIDGTQTMLVELPYNKTIDQSYIEKMDRLIAEYAITPVLAHIERYPSLIRRTDMLERFLDIGCVFQTNLSSYEEFGKRRLINLVKKGYIGAFGTDAHNTTSRPPAYNGGYGRLVKSVSSEVLQTIQHTMAGLLREE